MSLDSTSLVAVKCPRCSQMLAIQKASLGKKGRCRACQHIFPLTEPSKATPVASETQTAQARVPAGRVEVHCPACTQPLFVLPTMLAKKGRCPTCEHVFVLEAVGSPSTAEQATEPQDDLELGLAEETPSAKSSTAAESSSTHQGISTSQTERVEVFCPECTQLLLVKPSMLGKKGRCPTCEHVFELQVRASNSSRPVPSQDVKTSAPSPANPSTIPTSPAKHSATSIQVSERATVCCPHCSCKMKVPRMTLGNKGLCPVCKQAFDLLEVEESPVPVPLEPLLDAPELKLAPMGGAGDLWAGLNTASSASTSLPPSAMFPATPVAENRATGSSYYSSALQQTRSEKSLDPIVLALWCMATLVGVVMTVIGVANLLLTLFFMLILAAQKNPLPGFGLGLACQFVFSVVFLAGGVTILFVIQRFVKGMGYLIFGASFMSWGVLQLILGALYLVIPIVTGEANPEQLAKATGCIALGIVLCFVSKHLLREVKGR